MCERVGCSKVEMGSIKLVVCFQLNLRKTALTRGNESHLANWEMIGCCEAL